MSSFLFASRVLHTPTASSAATSLRFVFLVSRRFVFPHGDLQLFPGLIYRMIKPKVVLLIFVSGKIVLTGAKVIPFF